MDEKDRIILQMLMANAKTSHEKIAERVGIKGPSVFERVKKLEERGIITGYSANVNAEKLGKNLTAFIHVSLEGGTRYADEREIAELIGQEQNIEECHIIAGEASLLLKVRVNTPQELQEVITGLRRIEGIANTNTTVVLSTTLDRPMALD